MNWKRRIKIALDLVKQTIQIFNLEEEHGMFEFALMELNDYYKGDYFNELSEQQQDYESKLILSSYVNLCNHKFAEYKDKTFKKMVEKVDENIAKQRLVADYFNDINNGNDDIASMNINDWIEEKGIIILEDISSSTQE